MSFTVSTSKQECFDQLKDWIILFEQHLRTVDREAYKEMQLRSDFLSPLLKVFGWDVDNRAGKYQLSRDVIIEENIEVNNGNSTSIKHPDYTLNVFGNRKLFIEAKKLSVSVLSAAAPAFQLRRYGWSAQLGMSILTNGEDWVIYDCRDKPDVSDDCRVGIHRHWNYKAFLTEFDELYNLLAYPSIAAGSIDEYFAIKRFEGASFDSFFLRQIERWRLVLAKEIILAHPEYEIQTVNFLVQRLLNRIIFLRICEDRDIANRDGLKSINNYGELKELFVESDKRYNSGLFSFVEDSEILQLLIGSDALLEIFRELYYPFSPFNFAVVDPTILSQVYEQFLGRRLIVSGTGEPALVDEPEIAASNGVVPTPPTIVDLIIHQTLDETLSKKSSSELLNVKIADICCGSGTFLLKLYDLLCEYFVTALVVENEAPPQLMYVDGNGVARLTLQAKQQIMLQCIYGVDINPYAVEVTKFSLSLKLLENENRGTINQFTQQTQRRLLPNLDANIKNGNSLIGEEYYDFNKEILNNNELLFRIRPFEWKSEFPFLQQTGGFDAIIGNFPYVRIQNMKKYSREEIDYYQNSASGYTVAEKVTCDKYYLFMQRSLSLLNSSGKIGCIVPHKFFIAKGAKTLRSYITTNGSLDRIIHFGINQVFQKRSTYVAIIVIDKQKKDTIHFYKPKSVGSILNGNINYHQYPSALCGENPWIFVSKEVERVFEKMHHKGTVPLSQVAKATVGLQTSKDEFYMFRAIAGDDFTYTFKFKEKTYQIEKDICKACLWDAKLEPFGDVIANAYLIFPYLIENGNAILFSEEMMVDRFPLAWKYFNEHKSLLMKRDLDGKDPKWYQFGRSQGIARIGSYDKLVWPVLSQDANYSYDADKIMITGGGNGPYYWLYSESEYSVLYLMGLLSHPVIERMVRVRASGFRGNYYSHGKQFLVDLPVPIINFNNTEEKAFYDELIRLIKMRIEVNRDLKSEMGGAKIEVVKRKINFITKSIIQIVNRLYRISETDCTAVVNDPMFDLEEIKE